MSMEDHDRGNAEIVPKPPRLAVEADSFNVGGSLTDQGAKKCVVGHDTVIGTQLEALEKYFTKLGQDLTITMPERQNERRARPLHLRRPSPTSGVCESC